MAEDIIIDDSNFGEYFYDVAKHRPKKGQILARFRAVAELIDEEIRTDKPSMKRDIIYLLKAMPEGGHSAVKVMDKLGCAVYEDAINVPLEIAKDLLDGMSEKDVLKKPYRYNYEQLFYTQREYVPKNKHWTIIELVRVEGDEMIETVNGGEIRTKIIMD